MSFRALHSIFDENTDIKTKRKTVILLAVLLLSNILIFLTVWLKNELDNVIFDQFLYQVKSPVAGSQASIVGSCILYLGGGGISLTLIESFFIILLNGISGGRISKSKKYKNYKSTKFPEIFKKIFLPFVIIYSLFSILLFGFGIGLFNYFNSSIQKSSYIEVNYTDPKTVDIKFPENKRNLVYIFVESMESSFVSTKDGGCFDDDTIPLLTRLAKENVSFSNTDKIGGARTYAGSSWTAGAMVSQTSGLPVKISLTDENLTVNTDYMPGAYSLGQVLKANGYRQLLLLGSDADFAARSAYFKQHGDYEILDVKALKKQGRLPEDYQEWWGFEDKKLFRFAKEEILKLANGNEPFNLTILTADTHFPNGYKCEDCPTVFESQYRNVLMCSATRIYEFCEWLKTQDFYENTTVVICGDHLTMEPHIMETADKNYTRTIYNCILNSAVTPEFTKNRQFTTIDMYPTTLAALGAEIKGDRLALGTNLFSGTKTLTEQFGFEFSETELQKKSDFYDNYLFKLPKEN